MWREGVETIPPKLSICIATYNRGRFIGETLDSILSQPLEDVEIVVVDGASPDETPAAVAPYLQAHPGIRYYREAENSGVDRDYDKAVGYARGEYCWLMTDDDLMAPGAVSRVLEAIGGSPELVVVNAQVRNHDFSKVLQERMLDFRADRDYGPEDGERFFSEAAGYLSFIGGVVIRRELWLRRDRAPYFGSLFIHIGVIFQHPPLRRIRAIAEPLIVIRYGNAMWTSRSFEIWMFKWPELIWSFGDFSDRAKGRVYPREPWKEVRKLVFFRATGGYTPAEYRRLLRGGLDGASRLLPWAIGRVPAPVMNFISALYCIARGRKARTGMYDLSRCGNATWASRIGARILGVG
ncbi:MAG: glycosyltransferase family 2 protein [Thermodesulfobacteriota bacterium]